MDKVKIGDIIYLQKDQSDRLNVIKCKVLNTEPDYFVIENCNNSRFQFKWLYDGGEIIFLKFPLRNYNDGIYSRIEDNQVGEWLYLKTTLANKVKIIADQARGIFDLNKISMEELGLLKGLDSFIDEYKKARDDFVEYSISIRRYD